jgi:hypothetical protein
MKNYLAQLFLWVLILCCFPFLSMGQNFEGIVYFEVSDLTKQGMGELPYMIKENKARMEFGEGQQKGAILLLPDESKMVFVMDAMKGYITMDADQAPNDTEEITDAEASKTEKTKTIAGRECEVWQIESENNIIEACMAQGMGTFMMPKSPMGQDNTPQWAKELIAQGAMPLEVIELKNGNQTVQMRATKIEEKSLSADLFEIPNGYNDMSGMMKQMQNQN